MQFVETILIALISIQLVILFLGLFNGQKIKKWYLLLPLLALGYHLQFEGYRWQMIPAYSTLFVLILIQFANRKPKKLLKRLQNVVLVFLLALSIFLGSALPVLHFEVEEGAFNVGVKNYHFIDSNRDEVLTDDPNDLREISVRIYYPTPADANASYPYILNFDRIRHTYQKKLGWPSPMLSYLKLFSINAIDNAEAFPDQKFPVVFYSHGLTNNYYEASGRLLKIASEGYVVVAINHTYSSNFSILSNNQVVGYKALSQLGDPIEKIDSVKTIIANQWINDVEFTKNSLSPELKSADFENIGLLGFSAGGTMATLGGYQINHVKAAINLDGTPRGVYLNATSNCPQLFMFSEPEVFSDAQLNAWGIARKEIEAPILLKNERAKSILAKSPKGSEIINVPNTRHSNFIEYPLISPLSSSLGIGGNVDAKACYDLINTKILDFLNQNLKDQ